MATNNDRNKYEQIGEHVSIFRRGQVWWINYQLNGQQSRYSLRTKSKKQARLQALKIEAQLAEGQEPRQACNASIDDVVAAYDAFLVSEERSPKTLSRYRLVFRRIKELASRKGLKGIGDLTISFVDAYRALRKKDEAAPKTIHVESVVIKQLVNFALSRDMLQADPLKKLKLKRPRLTPQPCWSAGQRDKILEAARVTPYHSLYGLLAATGMRIAEAKYLTWEDVDVENGVLHIRPKQIGPGKRDVWKPKTGDQRVVPLSTNMVRLLQKLPHHCRWVFTAPTSARCSNSDRPVDERRVLYHLKKVLKKLELPGHVHTFRHTLISQALLSGTPEAVVRQWVGHVDPEILKHYTHVANADSKRFMERLDSDSQEVAAPDHRDKEDGGPASGNKKPK